MEDEILKKIEARIQELPKDVQAAVLSNDFEAQIAKIGQANRLHIDQIGELGDEVLLVMFGFASTDGFAERIQRKLHIYSDQAATIATQTDEEIFLPIRASMQKFQDDQKKAAHPVVQSFGPSAATSAPVIPTTPSAAVPAEVPAVDMMLSQKTISMPAQKPVPAGPIVTAPKIGPSYKTDPYREPVEEPITQK